MFEGFPKGATKFFKELAKNNNREWFAEHKPRYEELVLNPALDLVTDMASPLKKVSKHFCAIPKKSGGSLMRIYRDTRFSKDKTPYKTNLGIHFRHEVGKDVHGPGFYFHIDAKEIFIGAGIWRPGSQTLNQIRRRIDDDPKAWKRIKGKKEFKTIFDVNDDSLKRPPRGYEADHALIDELKLKNHFVIAHLKPADILDRKLIDKLCKHFKLAMPYVRFLCDSIPLPS